LKIRKEATTGIYSFTVESIAICGAESWPINNDIHIKLLELSFWRGYVRKTFEEKIRNEVFIEADDVGNQ
jgi:hypothetical protein